MCRVDILPSQKLIFPDTPTLGKIWPGSRMKPSRRRGKQIPVSLMCLHNITVLSLNEKITFIIQENWSFSCCWHCIEIILPQKCSVEPLNGLPYGVWFKSVNPHLISFDDNCNEALHSKLLILFKCTSVDITSVLSNVTSKRI